MAGTTEGGKKASQGGRGRDVASPAAVENYLKGIDFPANKKKLMQQARDNDAPEDVMHTIERLPEQQYNSPIDVSKAMKDM
ncbi:MAG: DUF2795 domain-containing protein [Syntrophorhabdaceae bacterium]